MAVTDVRIVRRSGGYGVGTRSYETVFEVTCAASDSIPTILTASEGGVSIPTIGTAYGDDAYATCTKVGDARQLGDGFTQWEVPVTYERPSGDVLAEDPLDDKVRVSWGVRLVEEVVTWDKDGNPIDNSAGEPFDPPLMEEVAILTVRIVRNEATYGAADAFSYANAVNSSACTIAGLQVGARKARCLGIPGDNATRNGIDYWQKTYEFEFKMATWDRRPLDLGMYYLSAGEPLTFKDDEGAPMQVPQLLDGAGAAGATPVFLTFRTKAEKSFGALGLGSV